MTTPLRVPGRRRWSAKQYILASLLGMLATAAVVAAISISLAPAHIAFSVRDANITSTHRQVNSSNGKQLLLNFWYYNLTLVANNTSHRTKVSYGSLTVDIWRSETAWISTNEVNTSAALPGWLPPGNTALVKLGVEGGQYNEETTAAPNGARPPPPPSPAQGASNVANSNATAAAGVAKWPDCQVVVEAQVWFRFAGVPTLPYTVRVFCFPVNFLDGTSGPVNCTG